MVMHHFLTEPMNAFIELRYVLFNCLVHFRFSGFPDKKKRSVNVKFCHADWLPANVVAANGQSRSQTESEVPILSRRRSPLPSFYPKFNNVLVHSVVVRYTTIKEQTKCGQVNPRYFFRLVARGVIVMMPSQ